MSVSATERIMVWSRSAPPRAASGQAGSPELELGTRNIRSAGQGSGSIEVTLPSPLRDLTGLPCRIGLRDGLRPEIVLAPDLRPARDALARLWALLTTALSGPAGELPLAEIGIAMLPDPGLERLGWADALSLHRAPPHPPEALCRALRAMALAAGPGLGLAGGARSGFAAAAAYTVTGLVPLPADQAACEIAAGLAGGRPRGLPDDDAFAPLLWRQATAPLRRQLELHRELSARPERLAILHQAWRQGVALEFGGQ